MITIKEAYKTGATYIKRTESAKRVYRVEGYCRANKAYTCVAFDDTNAVIYIKGEKPVFVDFEF